MITCIIQARMGSSRLPGKVMQKISENKTVIDFVVDQLQESKMIEKIIVAIPDQIEDNVTYDHLISRNISTYRGSLNNVLDRFYQCANSNSSSIIIRITADCPLIDPDIVDKVIKKFIENKFDYVANTHPRTFPYGTETEVFSFNALKIAWEETDDEFDKEHVTPYFYKNPDKFKIGNFSQKTNQSNYRWTIDYEEDLEFARKIFSKLKPFFSKDDVLTLVNNEPELMNLTKNIHDSWNKNYENNKVDLRLKYE